MVKPLLPVRWSRRALETLDEGLGYMAHFNPEAAHALRVAIVEALEQVRAFPRSARRVPEVNDPLIREILREPFRIMYEIQAQELRIRCVRRMERGSLDPDEP